jgi:hypothetical protein
VEAVDVAEKKRGFKPPLFVDIRLQRTVRTKGFSGDAFALVVGASRYKWMRELGNRSIVTGNSRIQIDRPMAAQIVRKVDGVFPPELHRSPTVPFGSPLHFLLTIPKLPVPQNL